VRKRERGAGKGQKEFRHLFLVLCVVLGKTGFRIQRSFYLKSLIINVIYRTGLRGKLFSQTA
jgi:hypothetical protein